MPRWIPRVLLLAVLTYFLALLALAAFRQLRNIILWLIAALFLSFALEPAVNWLAARGWRRGTATGVVILGLALVMLVAAAMVLPGTRSRADPARPVVDQVSVYTSGGSTSSSRARRS
jgi:predicted PurR-regulated permease PerM